MAKEIENGRQFCPNKFRTIYDRGAFESHVLFAPMDAGLKEISEAWNLLKSDLDRRSREALNGGREWASRGGDVYPWKIMVASEDGLIRDLYSRRHLAEWEPETQIGRFVQDCLAYYEDSIGSEYRELVERAILEEHAYKMVQNGKGWTFEQVKGEEYEKLARDHGVIHQTLGKVNLQKVDA